MTNRMPIVGAYYRPPAQAIIDHLPVGVPLWLRAEPDNPADPNAIAVWLKSSDVPAEAHAALDVALANFGKSIDDFLEQEEWHLGYIPKTMATPIRLAGCLDEPEQVEFGLSPEGKPRIFTNLELPA